MLKILEIYIKIWKKKEKKNVPCIRDCLYIGWIGRAPTETKES